MNERQRYKEVKVKGKIVHVKVSDPNLKLNHGYISNGHNIDGKQYNFRVIK